MSRALFGLLGAGLAGAFVVAWRLRVPFGIALPLVTAAGMGAAVYSTTRIPGWAQPYLLGWMSMLGLAALVGIGIGVGASPRVEGARARRLAALALGVAVACAGFGIHVARSLLGRPASPPDPQSEWVRALAEPAAPALRTCGARRLLVEVERPVPRAVAVGVLLALDKSGIRFGVVPFGPFRFGGRMAPDGTEDAMLLVGAENSAWTDRQGARMLAREGGVFLYLLPGPPRPEPPG
jgi:hypothetical protein